MPRIRIEAMEPVTYSPAPFFWCGVHGSYLTGGSPEWKYTDEGKVLQEAANLEEAVAKA